MRKDEWCDFVILTSALILLMVIPPFIPLVSGGLSALFMVSAGCGFLSVIVTGDILTRIHRLKAEREKLIVEIQELWQELLSDPEVREELAKRGVLTED